MFKNQPAWPNDYFKDPAALEDLAREMFKKEATPEEKNMLSRAAARAGYAGLLRRLFERDHLYGTDPDEQGRTLLHYAAMSGDEDTTRFTLDVLGFDPLEGDLLGRTPLDEARIAPKPEAYALLREKTGFSPEQGYRNPVLRGFHPDPSVLRTGEDYYLVNSSFVFFPGLPIFHSRDLVRWHLNGHAAENLEISGLAGLPGGYGYWAPDISWYRGRFWVVATLRRDKDPVRLQMITSAEKPQGPWAPPRFLPLDGIDPSLFTDDDGRRYILLNPGAILAEINAQGELISEPEMIFFGDARIKPEGPHLLKKDGWYYLFLAEGGTGFDHCETVMRSRNLRGPYEACPFNPILSRRSPHSPVQRSGHGKPVSTPDGRWYMVYLCGRNVEGQTVMGRETALDPMSWTADGWPVVNRLRGPSCLQALPCPEAAPFRAVDTENPEWISPRSDPADFATLSGSCITLQAGPDPAGTNPCSLLLRRQREACFLQSVRVDLTHAQPGTLGGITGYYDERSFFVFGLRKTETGCRAEILEQVGESRRVVPLGEVPGCIADLAAEGKGMERQLRLKAEGAAPICSGLHTGYLSDEGLTGGKRFTGAALGLAALGKGSVTFLESRFLFTDPLESAFRQGKD